MAKITDLPMHEACANGDGTYDGRKLVRWLFEATTNRPMSEAEAETLVSEARDKAAARRKVE